MGAAARLNFAVAAFFTSVVLTGVGLIDAPAQAAPPSNLVYTQTNDPAGNAILAYTRANDGRLTPLPGSPFPTGGLGITPTFNLGPFDSDQEVIVNAAHSLLFTVNGGSDSISVFKINGDGSLTPAPGSPFPSGGSNPVSVGLFHDTLCVVNADQDPGHPGQGCPNFTSFHVSESGALTPVPNSTVNVPAGSSPSQALISPLGPVLLGADFLGGLLRSFSIAKDGRLTLLNSQPLPSAVFAGTGAPPLPLGLAAHPKFPAVYVGFVTINRIGIYGYSSDGGLNFINSVPNSGQAVCWLLLNKSATRLYTSNTGDQSISVYDCTRASAPVEIQKVTFQSTGGGFQIALDSTGLFLHVVTQQSAPTSDQSANAIHVFSVAGDGKLTEVPSSPTVLPVPNLVRPQGVAAL
jgi:6-phosphogluconolactonase (cycloisomerase 2 family)